MSLWNLAPLPPPFHHWHPLPPPCAPPVISAASQRQDKVGPETAQSPPLPPSTVLPVSSVLYHAVFALTATLYGL